MSAPAASLTAGELSAAGKAALAMLAVQDLVRVKSGWRGRGTPMVTLRVAASLKARGLAREEISGGRHRLAITAAGRMLAGVIEERRKRA